MNYGFLLSSSTTNAANAQDYSYWYRFLNLKPSRFFFFALLGPTPASAHPSNSRTSVAAGYSIFFLRKEVFYTKLKYSRVPQFDTSAGAAASFLSGMYGFMISEKFGFELIDSGDFLFLALFIAFLVLFGSMATSIFNARTSLISDFISSVRSFFI